MERRRNLIFHDPRYMETLNLGEPMAQESTLPLIIRKIPSTPHSDAVLSWPYVDLKPGELSPAISEISEVVSVVGTLLPGTDLSQWNFPSESGITVSIGKPHFLFNPLGAALEWSASTRSKIRRASAMWEIRPVTIDFLASVTAIYRQMISLQDRINTFWDFSIEHFTFLFNHSEIEILGVFDENNELGGFICLAQSANEWHAIHMASTEEAKNTWAMYSLMNSLINNARESESKVFFGGLPSGNKPGSVAFKERWSNEVVMAPLLKIIRDSHIYRELSLGIESDFFPSYRQKYY